MAVHRSILITGGTGFVGGATVVAALRAGLGPKLLLTSRQTERRSATDRLLDNLKALGATPALLRSLGDGFTLEADLTSPTVFENRPALQRVERVIHSAALPTFSDNPAIQAVNVDATLNLARALNPGVLKRFVFVGTAMAVGTGAARGAVVLESDTLASAAGHLVPYTASKAEAERRLRAEFPSLPLVVARPSIVVGHTQLGVKPSQSIFWVFLVGHMLGAFTCELEDRIDVVPVDWCADVLLSLALRDALAHDVYHVSAGRESSDSIAQLDLVLASARKVMPMGQDYRRIGGSDIGKLLPRLRNLVPEANRRLLRKAMELYGGFAELNYVFDTHRLRTEGLSASPRFSSYLARCVDSAAGIPISEQMRWDFK